MRGVTTIPPGALRTFTAAQYKLYDRMRHPRAFEVARQEGTEPDFSALRGARQCLVVTFRRSGEPVPTPVNFGLSDDGRLYFRSEPDVAKVRRLRRDPHVRVCACNLRAKPRGPLAEGIARVLPGTESEHAYAVVSANWRTYMEPFERTLDRLGVPTVYIEVVPAGA
jgi:PPOX class probable F420-dependent enzyme